MRTILETNALHQWPFERPRFGALRAAAVATLMAFAAGCSGGFSGEDVTEERSTLSAFAEEGASRAGRAAPSHSSPIALSDDDSMLWAVSPDTDSVSVIRTDTNQKVASVPVGARPQSVALDPVNRFAYVANFQSNDVSVIDVAQLRAGRAPARSCERRVVTGSAPAAVVVSPDGRRVFVANSSQDTVTVLDGRDQTVVGVIDLRNGPCNADDPSRHFQPRALAVTADGRRLYVTRFLSYTRAGGVQRDDFGKEGLVCRVDLDRSVRWRAPAMTPIRLAASDSGFLDKNGNTTAAFPNQLQSIVLRDGHAYLPNIAASPRGPLHFDVDTQAYVNRIDGVDGVESDSGALNLHLGARVPEAGKLQLFFANPWAIEFSSQHGAASAYVVSAGSDLLVKLDVDSAGALHFTGGDSTTRYIDLNDPDAPETSGSNAGKNPIGIAIDKRGSRAYVLNYVSRNVSVVDLSGDRVEAVIPTESLPAPGSEDELVLVGAEVFFTSRGNFVRPPGAQGSSRDRMSEQGHQDCASCHPGGLTDGVVWQFNSGPRKTIAINGTTNPRDRSQQRIINASAIFDEFEDVDFNTRRVSGIEPLATARTCVDAVPPSGQVQSTNDPDHGLILGEEGDFSMAACVLVPFTTANAGRPQARVQLPGSPVQVNAMDAMKEWQRVAIVTPNRPMTASELAAAGLSGGVEDDVLARGRDLFTTAGCASCHGSGQWTEKKKDFVSPPALAEISTEKVSGVNSAQYLFRFLTEVGTFDLNVAGSNNLIAGFPPIGGIEKDSNELNALGFDYDGDGKGSGFNTPSLLGALSVPPYFHNGACETLQCVLADASHRRAGLPAGQADPLDDDGAKATLAAFLESIDVGTAPVGGN